MFDVEKNPLVIGSAGSETTEWGGGGGGGAPPRGILRAGKMMA